MAGTGLVGTFLYAYTKYTIKSRLVNLFPALVCVALGAQETGIRTGHPAPPC